MLVGDGFPFLEGLRVGNLELHIPEDKCLSGSNALSQIS